MSIDLRRMKMYVDVMNVAVRIASEDSHWRCSPFDWIETTERSGQQGYSMWYHMNDVEHDATKTSDC